MSSKLVLKYGLILGVSLCMYTLFMWVTQLDTTYLHIGQYIDVLITLLPFYIIITAIKRVIKLVRLNLFNRFIIAMFISVIAYLIYNPFLYLYHNSLNPSWFNAVLALKEKELIEINLSVETIQSTLEKMKAANDINSRIFSLSSLIPSVIILPALSSILSYIVLKSKSTRNNN